ncbi:MAG: hypothetical protein OEQ90_08100 [Gammaproteobacteria bacterium]|nr:hypothetical protein [Gammaproteobacteria bacterium]
MGLEYSITHEESYVEIHVRGQGDYLSTHKMWKDIAAACRKNNCHNILGVANIDVRSLEHAYDHAAIFEAAGMTSAYRIAWVEINPSAHESAKLVEAVIRNRGLADGRVFDGVREARRWLAETAAP